jgi:predicted aldo/keto reductase-like oxidoreductase
MKYRRFGKTNINMPVLTCGGMRFQHSWDDLRIGDIPEKSQKNLDETVKHAFELGINHFETARKYGCSEIQLGQAIQSLPRNEIIIQTKIPPTNDLEEFTANLEKSFLNLHIKYADLIAIHGINDDATLLQAIKCFKVLEQWKLDGRIRHIGFSTHASPTIIKKTIKTGLFDYVNLHYYYIYQDTIEALKLAKKYDLGVSIISPNDKGGKLYDPPVKLKGLTAPLTPMQFNDLFCLAAPGVSSLTIGASTPNDFEEHIKILKYLDDDAEVSNNLHIDISEKLNAEMERVLSKEWINACKDKLPAYYETPNSINIPVILRLYNLAKSLNMLEYGKMRYNLLGKGGTWFPGNNAANIDDVENEIISTCKEFSFPSPEDIPNILFEAHKLFYNDEK